MNNINTFQVHENELCLRGTDEHGEDFTCWFDAYDFLDWIDTENLEYIKEKLIQNNVALKLLKKDPLGNSGTKTNSI